MFNKVNTLDNKLEDSVTKIKPRKARLQMEDDSEMAAMFSRLRTRSDMQISKQTQKSQRSRDSGSESDDSSSESE